MDGMTDDEQLELILYMEAGHSRQEVAELMDTHLAIVRHWAEHFGFTNGFKEDSVKRSLQQQKSV